MKLNFAKKCIALVTEYSTKQKQNYLIHQEEKKDLFPDYYGKRGIVTVFY